MVGYFQPGKSRATGRRGATADEPLTITAYIRRRGSGRVQKRFRSGDLRNAQSGAVPLDGVQHDSEKEAFVYHENLSTALTAAGRRGVIIGGGDRVPEEA